MYRREAEKLFTNNRWMTLATMAVFVPTLVLPVRLLFFCMSFSFLAPELESVHATHVLWISCDAFKKNNQHTHTLHTYMYTNILTPVCMHTRIYVHMRVLMYAYVYFLRPPLAKMKSNF